MNKYNNESGKNSLYEFFIPRPLKAIAEGKITAQFTKLDDVEKWVEGHGEEGRERLKAMLEQNELDEATRTIGRLWLEKHAEIQDLDFKLKQLAELTRAANAAKDSAKWAMWAAIISAFGVISGVVISIYEIYSPKEPVKIELYNFEQQLSSETILQPKK